MNPKQRAGRSFPFIEHISVDEPFRASLMVGLACDIIVFRRIRRRQPTSKALLHVVAYNIVLAIVARASKSTFERTARFVYVAREFLDEYWHNC